MAPDDLVIINAEIDELLEGDIPYFSAVAREGRLHGQVAHSGFRPVI